MFRRALTAIVGIVILGAIAFGAWVLWFEGRTSSSPALQRESGQDFHRIERGRDLATLADCAGCHDGRDPSAPLAGGKSIETPFGTVLAANITPDRETGVGAWSDDEFDAAVRRGESSDGKPLYPAMPYPYYARMSRSDVLAIRAYLKTIAPVHNPVVADQLPFPFSIRASMRLWNALYFHPGEFGADPTKSAEWNRGAYLVQGPGHCGACHTPKTFLGGDDASHAFEGYSIQGWFAPNITNDAASGLGGWSVDDVVAYLKTGHNAFAAATGPMAEEIAVSSSHMTDADLKAIAVYLKDQRAREEGAPSAPASAPVMAAGGAVYHDLCSGCHASDGSGVPDLFPALAKAPSVRARDPATLIRVLLRGARSVATASEPTAPAMPAFGWQLNDEQAAAVLTYVRNSWGASAPAVSSADIRQARAALAWRSD